ncbi:hypothetical protein PspLS_07579 [Pyricularia sp. CBS 133598]|nr:hypothetical protein PspLS_07579 [Pyricularia sp. CBS 133598]
MSNTTKSKPNDNDQEEEEEDDYMNMVFTDPTPSAPETSLQRRQRERREAAERARHKSKAELAAEEADKREAALARSLIQDETTAGTTSSGGAGPKNKSKGLAMMAKMGFRAGQGLGAAEGQQGRTEPVRIVVREDRGGIGLDGERKRKMREAYGDGGEEGSKARKVVVDEDGYRERVAREREEARLERVLGAAQKVAEKMADEEDEDEDVKAGGGDDAARRKPRPLKSVNVLWRGLVRQREEAERERRMRHDLQQSLSRLPTYEDDDEDEDDRRALGKDGKKAAVVFEDLDEEDAELDEFNAKGAAERLQSVVDYLRSEHRYCFWCKYRYADEEMEGCPGRTEEDHD